MTRTDDICFFCGGELAGYLKLGDDGKMHDSCYPCVAKDGTPDVPTLRTKPRYNPDAE